MVTDGKITPAPWVPFTRAGCDFGAVSLANIELENTGTGTFGDMSQAFGTGSPEWNDAVVSNAAPSGTPARAKAFTDYVGIAIHCSKSGGNICAANPTNVTNSRLDKLPDEPGGGRLMKTQHGLDRAGRRRWREERDRALRQRSSRGEGLAGRCPRVQPEHLHRRQLQDMARRDDAHRGEKPRGRDIRDLPGGRGTVAPADVCSQHANAGQRLPTIELRACEERRGDGGRERRNGDRDVERRAGTAAKGSCDEDRHLHRKNAQS